MADELEVAAKQARTVGQVRELLGWIGSGRKLTQTGRITLADARVLVKLLDTGDVIDPRIENCTFWTVPRPS